MAKKKLEDETVELGDLCKDIITGYVGVATSFQKHLTGCDRWTLQAQITKEDKIPDGYNFDVTTVVVVKKRVAIPSAQWQTVPAEPATVVPEARRGGPHTKARR